MRLGLGLAHVATTALLEERDAGDSHALPAQLQTAVNFRVFIEQAKGVIAAHTGTTVADAFLMMRSTARRRGTRLHDLSMALVEGRADSMQLDSCRACAHYATARLGAAPQHRLEGGSPESGQPEDRLNVAAVVPRPLS